MKTGVDRDKARIQKQEENKKEALEREENIIKKEKIDSFIKNLQEKNPEKYKRIFDKCNSEILDTIKGKFRNTMVIAKVRTIIHNLYIK